MGCCGVLHIKQCNDCCGRVKCATLIGRGEGPPDLILHVRRAAAEYKINSVSVTAEQRCSAGTSEQSGTDPVEPALSLATAQVTCSTMGTETVG